MCDMGAERLKDCLRKVTEMLDKCVTFWMNNSLDEENGGFYNCLTETGAIYDTTKYGWLQGRQVWMLAVLYNEVQRFHTGPILQAALKGGEFLRTKIRCADKPRRCYFSVTKLGAPIAVQRTIFSEAFYSMAMCELFRATGQTSYLDEGREMINACIDMAWKDSSELMVNRFQTGSCSLNVPLIILGLLEQLYKVHPDSVDQYSSISEKCVREIKKHSVEVGGVECIVESIGPDGQLLSGSEGSLLNPGHSIEAAWFLLEYMIRFPEKTSEGDRNWTIDKFLSNPLKYGWDNKFGGLFYFLDCRSLALEGNPDTPACMTPTALEWSMKLWWPHSEALIALLMTYDHTRDEDHLGWFYKVFEYAVSHFNDETNGEWYGYCSREGNPTSLNKGAPFKGFFHVPRCLMMCEQLLNKLLE